MKEDKKICSTLEIHQIIYYDTPTMIEISHIDHTKALSTALSKEILKQFKYIYELIHSGGRIIYKFVIEFKIYI